jgi:uncharacterized repeat protein (TIGR02543 family)
MKNYRMPLLDRCAPTKSLVIVLLLACALGELATPLRATDRHWTGATSANIGYNRWSDPNNWDPVGVPQNGETLIFDRNTSNNDMDNDIQNLTVASLIFYADGDVFASDFSLNGYPLTLTHSIEQNPVAPQSYTVTIGCGLALAGAARFTVDDGFDLLGTPNELHLDGPISLSGGYLSLQAVVNAGLYVSGKVSGNGSVYADSDGGRVILDGAEGNTFTGPFIVGSLAAFDNGRVVLKKQSGLAVPGDMLIVHGQVELGQSEQIASTATVTVENGSQLLLEGYYQTIGSLVLSNVSADADASIVDTGSGLLGVWGGITSRVDNASVIPTIKGRLNLPGGAHIFDVSGTPFSTGLDMQAQIDGDGGLFKTGNAAMLLESINDFTGGVSVDQGILDVRNNGALGAVINSDNRVFLINGSLTLRNVSITGKTLYAEGGSPVTADTTGSLLYTLGTCAWGGPIVLDSSLVVFAGDTVTLSGPISSAGGLEFLYGTAVITGPAANTYSGATLVHCALLEFDKPSGVQAFSQTLVIGSPGSGGPFEARWLNSYQGDQANVTLYPNGILNLNGYQEIFGSVTINARALLDLNGSNLGLRQLNLNDGGSVQTGSGTLLFSPGGVVNVGSQSRLGSHVHSSITGNIQIAGNDILTFFVNPYAISFPFDPAPELDLPANIYVDVEQPQFAPAGVTKEALGHMRLSGNNSFKGLTRINDGTLIAAGANALGTADNGTAVNNGASLALDGGVTINNEALYLASSNSAAFQSLSGSNTWGGAITLSQPAAISVSQAGGYLQVPNTVSGSGSLTKLGPGTLQFGGSAANSYLGTTIVSEGVLELGRANQISVPGDVVVGDDTTSTTTAILRPLRDQQFTPSARLNLHSSGLLDLSPASGVPVPAPTIGSLVGAGTVNLGAGTSLSLNNSANCAFGGVISGSGAFNKLGAALLQLTAYHTNRDNINLSAGTLQVDGSQPQSAVKVSSGKLQGTGVLGVVDLNGSSAVVEPGGGPGILTCGNLNPNGVDSGTLNFALNGLTPGSGYDQLNVQGAVNLTGLTLSGSLAFASSLSNTFTIIKNNGGSPVVGRFAGLNQNATLTIGWEQFRINYTGGAGNDVVLTQITSNGVPLILNVIGSGSVSRNPDHSAYPYGTTVTLTATPNPGWDFRGWSGDAGGADNPLTVTMTASKTITANFLPVGQVTRIASGGSHSLFTKPDGTLWGMGDNSYGQLGLGQATNGTAIPQQIASGVGAVAAGGSHSLFLSRGVWAMGYNGYGQLGDGTTTNHYVPEKIFSVNPRFIGLTGLSAGGHHGMFASYSLIQASPGSLWAMGQNGFGQLGDGTTTDHHTPEAVVSSTSGSPVTASASGLNHTLFIRPDGSLWGMGYNADGELGDGTITERNTPVQIVSGGVVAAAAGQYHSLFIKSDGSLWAMGANNYGQLGDGTTSSRQTPEQIVSSGVVAVAAGVAHSLFIKSDGSLWAMGYNSNGQLGDGTTTGRNVPVLIVASNVVAVVGGYFHTLFIKSDGGLWAMGNNSNGQLGDGTFADRLVPVEIVRPPPPPQLTITASSANVILAWPTTAVGFTLQSATDLGSPAAWTTVSSAPTVVNGQNTVTDPISGPRKFYRLAK